MTAPFIFAATHTINEGKLDEYMGHNQEFLEFVKANEPDLLEFGVYSDEGRQEVTSLLVFPDSVAADRHMQISGELIGRGLQNAQVTRLEVFGGEPGPILGQALQANAEQGISLRVKSDDLGGFSRSRVDH